MCHLSFLQKHQDWGAMSPCTPPYRQCSNKHLGNLWERSKQLMKPPAPGANLGHLSPFSTPPARTHSGSLPCSAGLECEVLDVLVPWPDGGSGQHSAGAHWNCPGACVTTEAGLPPHTWRQRLWVPVLILICFQDWRVVGFIAGIYMTKNVIKSLCYFPHLLSRYKNDDLAWFNRFSWGQFKWHMWN